MKENININWGGGGGGIGEIYEIPSRGENNSRHVSSFMSLVRSSGMLLLQIEPDLLMNSLIESNVQNELYWKNESNFPP